MIWWLLPTIGILAAILSVGCVLWRRLPDVRLIDPETAPNERAKRLKQAILTKRFQQVVGELFSPLTEKTRAASGAFSQAGRRMVQDLTVLKKARDPKQPEEIPEEAEEIERAQVAYDAGELSRAEDLLIACVGKFPRSVEAYELLSDVYVSQKQLDQARETLEFVLKIAPERVEALLDLARLADDMGQNTQAWRDLQRAERLRPRDPRVIDRLLRHAVEQGKVEAVQTYLPISEEVNPSHPEHETWRMWLAEKGGK